MCHVLLLFSIDQGMLEEAMCAVTVCVYSCYSVLNREC